MDVSERVEIHHSIVYDFLASMYRLNNNEKFLDEIEELKLKDRIMIDQDILDWVKKNRDIVTTDIQEKLDMFFNRETFYGLCLISIIVYNRIDTVEKFINYIKHLPCQDIFMEFLDTGYGAGEELNKSLVEKLLNNEKAAISFINKNLSIPSKQKRELLQFFLNPEKVKEDLISLFIWYNNNIYKHYIDVVEAVVIKYESELKIKLKQFGEEYLKLLTNTDFKNLKAESKIFISVSYYYETSKLYSYRSEPGKDIYMFGYRYSEIFIEGKHVLLSNVQMFKSVADETRLNIIKLLCERKWYGHELALKLNLSNSTVSYHLSMMVLNGFVKVERVDNRTYFSSDVGNIKTIICDSLDKMVHS